MSATIQYPHGYRIVHEEAVRATTRDVLATARLVTSTCREVELALDPDQFDGSTLALVLSDVAGSKTPRTLRLGVGSSPAAIERIVDRAVAEYRGARA
jgi:hypothetical protein